MAEKTQVTKDIIKYLTEVIEVPSQEFSGFAVCPFSKPERTRGRLFIGVFDPDEMSFPDCMKQIISQGYSSAALALFQGDTPVVMSKSETGKFSKFLNGVMKDSGISDYKNICINPNDQVSMGEYNPRSLSPYFLIVVSRIDDLDKGKKSLTKTKYYDKMPDRYKRFLNVDL